MPFLIAVLLFLFASPSFCFGHITFRKNNYDFGIVSKDQKIKHRFIFTNKGDTAVKIKEVYGSCGCEIIAFDANQVYGPNQTGFLDIQIDTSGLSGIKVFSITAVSDEPFYPYNVLSLKAQINESGLLADKDSSYQDDFFEPSHIELGSLGVYQVIERKVFFKTNKLFALKEKADFDIKLNGKPVDQVEDFVSYSFDQTETEKNQSTVIKLKIKNPSFGAGNLHGRVWILADAKNQKLKDQKKIYFDFYAFLQGEEL